MGEDAEMESIIQQEKECYFCGTTLNLHCHHIYSGSANRKQSEKYGMKCWLCADHHNMSNESVHQKWEMNLALKIIAQKKFEQVHGTREDFRKIFGKSYL